MMMLIAVAQINAQDQLVNVSRSETDFSVKSLLRMIEEQNR